MEARQEAPMLPPVAQRYLVAWWLEIGPSVSGPMGEGAVAWQDIGAWQALTCNQLRPWEAQAIRAMSRAFVGERHEARKPDCPAPYSGPADDARSSDRVDAQFKVMMSVFGERKNRG